ncbi:MAG: hypothetical protein KDB27_02270 [Planctomycetales bacterium]|nr:hypothetical protein [Planctomycetales bacterium]
MIQNLTTSYLLTSELKITAQRLTDIVLETLPNETFFQQLCQLIRQHNDLLEQITARSRTSSFTGELATHDAARDEAFVALRDYAKAISGRPSASLSQAGSLITRLIETRGVSLHRLGYAQQSAALNELLDDLSTPESQQAIETIHAEEWIDELRESHHAFEATFQEKVNAESQDDLPQVKPVRKAVSDRLSTLVSSLNALQEISIGSENETVVNQLAANVDEIISEILIPARARRTRHESATAIESELENQAIAAV